YDPIVTCAYVGLITLLLQNLFDLALEVPAVSIAVSVVCGGLLGRRKRDPEPRSSKVSVRHAVGGGFVLLELCGLIGALVLGRHTAIRDRDSLHQAYEALRRREPGADERFQRDLQAAISRHPGDGYLPLIAGVAAQVTNQPT